MKKIFTILSLFAFSTIAYSQDCSKKNLAEAPKYNGIYIFFMVEPLHEYDLITTMKKRVVISDMTDGFQKWSAAAKKEYPNCDAIIMRGVEMGFGSDKLEVIKFK